MRRAHQIGDCDEQRKEDNKWSWVSYFIFHFTECQYSESEWPLSGEMEAGRLCIQILLLLLLSLSSLHISLADSVTPNEAKQLRDEVPYPTSMHTLTLNSFFFFFFSLKFKI